MAHIGILLFIHTLQLLIDRSNDIYINRIGINTAERVMTFSYYKAWQGERDYTLSFDELKVKLGRSSIYFFRKRPGKIFLSAGKDHFSRSDIKEIRALLLSLTQQVKTKRSPSTAIDLTIQQRDFTQKPLPSGK